MDRFRTRENTFLSNIEDNIFHSLYEVKDYAHKNHNLALQWDMGRSLTGGRMIIWSSI